MPILHTWTGLSCACTARCDFRLISDVQPYPGFPWAVPNAVSNLAIVNLYNLLCLRISDLLPQGPFERCQSQWVDGPRNLFPNTIRIRCRGVLSISKNPLQWKRADTAASPRRKGHCQDSRKLGLVLSYKLFWNHLIQVNQSSQAVQHPSPRFKTMRYDLLLAASAALALAGPQGHSKRASSFVCMCRAHENRAQTDHCP